MCVSSRGPSIDTSAQDQQLAYQLAEQNRLAEERAAAERAQAEAQLQQQRDAATAELAQRENESRRQQEALQAQIAAERARQEQVDAAAAAERAAVEQAARDRADRQRTYATGRQSLIDAFNGDVNTAFSGFDDNYYNDYRANYTNAQLPKLQEDFAQQRRDLILAFADSGNLNSSAAARQFGKLEKAKTGAEADIANDAIDASTSLRSTIDQQKRETLSSLFTSSDIGRTDLPDGVTDVNGALGTLSTQISGLRNSARTAAANISAPNVGVGDYLSRYTSGVTAPRAPVSQFTRNGGYYPSSSGGSSPATYMVR